MFGIVSDSEFEGLLEEKAVSARIVNIQRGRGNAKEVPIEIKKLVSEEAISGASSAELARVFGISQSSVNAYKHDATSEATYNEPNEELKKHNDTVRNEISGTARSRLMSALDNITDEKLRDAKVRDTASVAKDMSAIIRNIEGSHDEGKSLNQQFIFYAPKPKEEKDFEFIDER